ncbi:MAG: ABC transporter ATP-binding protein [Candidatus Roizmanbacteria bacterium]
MPVISVRNLVKQYQKSTQRAIDDISFDVDEGSFFAFLGPNGAGKTTTISILTTTLAKTSGEIQIAGFDTEKEQSQVRHQIGVIFQNPSLDLNLSAEENIRFHAVLYGLYQFRPSYSMMPTSYKHKVTELAEIIGIQKELFHPIKTFSGGMKRKLEIIRSLIHSPKVLFLDEPTSGLDPLSRKNVWEYLKEIREKNGTTIFLTTHYLEEAESADTVAIINTGKIVIKGSPEMIKSSLVQHYLLIDAKDRERLQKELESKKFSFDIKENGFRVVLLSNTPQQIIQSLDTPLSQMVVHMPTLEDAYLAIVDGKK